MHCMNIRACFRTPVLRKARCGVDAFGESAGRAKVRTHAVLEVHSCLQLRANRCCWVCGCTCHPTILDSGWHARLSAGAGWVVERGDSALIIPRGASLQLRFNNTLYYEITSDTGYFARIICLGWDHCMPGCCACCIVVVVAFIVTLWPSIRESSCLHSTSILPSQLPSFHAGSKTL